MRKILMVIAVSAIFTSFTQAQDNCEATALGAHYIVPRGASLEVIKSGKFQAGISLMYNSLTTSEKGKHGLNYSLDILSFAGVRVYHKEYRTAVYTNIGVTMGDINGPRLWLSGKLMLLRNQKAWSIEPYYSGKPGLRLGIYKII